MLCAGWRLRLVLTVNREARSEPTSTSSSLLSTRRGGTASARTVRQAPRRRTSIGSPVEGVLFEQAITSAPLTLPAHSTLFTSLLPPRHGVRDNGGYVLDPEARHAGVGV